MDRKLLLRAGAALVLGLAAVGLLLFVPAGTMRFWNAWAFLALLFIPMLIVGVVLLLRAPALLAKRLNRKEAQSEQKAVVAGSALMFVVGFVVAGLDYRFGWSHLPLGVVVAAAIAQLASYGLYAEVLRENAYLSRTVEIQENQKVVDTGLYGIVRHPMYAATILLYLAMPLVLGSVYSFAVFLLYPPLIARRIQNEELVLERGLDGYAAYKARVRYRIIPYIW